MNNNIRKMLASSLVLLVYSLPTSAQDSIAAALNKCATIDDGGPRLVCYDALAELLVGGDARDASMSVGATAVAAPPPSGVVPITDEVGIERIEATEVAEAPKFSAKVTSCRENPQSGQYSFTFANGQVWKQSNYIRLNMRRCVFDVEITKGAFGYDMYIPDKDRNIRVKRIR